MISEALEFFNRCFDLKGEGWSILLFMGGLTTWMMVWCVDSTIFKVVAIPAVVLGGVVCQNAMTEFGLHFTTDMSINQGLGFGLGMVITLSVMCITTWVHLEMQTRRAR